MGLLFKSYPLEKGVDNGHILPFSLDLTKDIKYRNPLVLSEYVRQLAEKNGAILSFGR